jgi:DNA polymerase-3 subunit delta
MARQASTWGADRLERALAILIDTDLALRSSRPVPAMAMMERALIRLAMLGRR